MGNGNNNSNTYEDLPSVHSNNENEEDVESSDEENTAGSTDGLMVDNSPYASVQQDENALPTVRRHRKPPAGTASVLTRIWVTCLGTIILLFLGLLLFYKMDSGGSSGGSSSSSSTTKHPKGSKTTIHHTNDHQIAWNPLDAALDDRPILQPPNPWTGSQPENALGYLSQPSLVNNTLVFVSEGDLYLTRIDDKHPTATSLPAMRLSVTAGNVGTPKLHPELPILAFSATYTGRRLPYLLDLRSPSVPPMPATYLDNHFGVDSIVSWHDGRLVLAAASNTVSLPDVRLYELVLENSNDDSDNALDLIPVPLAQAIDGAYHQDCLYFTRFKQSSRTYRYVGGTAEHLWAYCKDKAEAIPLTHDYIGTSKHAQVVVMDDQPWLLFLSDRQLQDETSVTWTPTTMNLWALPLSNDVYTDPLPTPIALTHVSCAYQGRSLQEYSVDPVTHNIVLRIGADLHWLPAKEWQERLTTSTNRGHPPTPRLPIVVYSDFREQQERLVAIDIPKDVHRADVYDTAFGGTNMLLTIRGQVWVAPVLDDKKNTQPYQGAGQNLPPRRYRVVPGALTGGSMRVLTAVHVPLLSKEDTKTPRRLAVILATDPLSATAEHAFYLVETQSDVLSHFGDLDHLPQPFVGGHVNGGSTADGGLGSVYPSSVVVSPCGRRLAWTDTDGRICLQTLPHNTTDNYAFQVLPDTNELGEPLNGDGAELSWSPGGRYLAVSHNAENQFQILSICDCGDPNGDAIDEVVDISIGRIAQATPSRFNSFGMYWGKSTLDIDLLEQNEVLAKLKKEPERDDMATTLYFLTDRDITTDVWSPWGTRAPSPHFKGDLNVYGLPLMPKAVDGETEDVSRGRFSGGGAAEVFVDEILALEQMVEELGELEEDDDSSDDDDGGDRRRGRRLTKAFKSLTRAVSRKRRIREVKSTDQRRLEQTSSPSAAPTAEEEESPYPKDADIDFGPKDLTFARRAYRLTHIPKAQYRTILSQTTDDGSLALVETKVGEDMFKISQILKVFTAEEFPSDSFTDAEIDLEVNDYGLGTTREYFFFVASPSGSTKVVENTKAGLAALKADKEDLNEDIVDTDKMAVSIWPALEYKQMYDDAWRMLRDYFYDRDMTGIDWKEIHERYLSLVQRCSKREELDDVLVQMASELSALHVFVYGGEYNAPFCDDEDEMALHRPASLGVTLRRSPEWKGYMVTEIPLRDPDFNLMDGDPIYSPLSDQALLPSGQRGLEIGDVIVGVNGESVIQVPDINMLLRGMVGRSVRLEVLRLASGAANATEKAVAEPIVTVPITPAAAVDLRYGAWEWRTRQTAKDLATQAGFTVGYVHMRSMVTPDMNAFARGFFPDYDKQAFILDVRHNNGGNIDSWILSFLQRQAWMFWSGRNGMKNGDADWDEQFAFRGHIVVLIDEHTASDGEGVSRGISELGLGRLIGTRTWGGGIWLSSNNRLVDGGIATAPEIGTFNDKFGWGLGIEQHGVVPDIEVDNNPRTTFDGKDTQLERAIAELKQWLKDEPVVRPNLPGPKRDMSIHDEQCPA